MDSARLPGQCSSSGWRVHLVLPWMLETQTQGLMPLWQALSHLPSPTASLTLLFICCCCCCFVVNQIKPRGLQMPCRCSNTKNKTKPYITFFRYYIVPVFFFNLSHLITSLKKAYMYKKKNLQLRFYFIHITCNKCKVMYKYWSQQRRGRGSNSKKLI